MLKVFFRRMFGADAARSSATAICAVSFFIGALIGCVCAVYGDAGELAQTGVAVSTEGITLAGVAWQLVKYPGLLLLSGFAVFGVVSIPLILGVRGFFLSFTVAAFVKLYGGAGAVYSSAVFAVQCLGVLPCMLIIGTQALLSSSVLLSVSSGRGRKLSDRIFSTVYFTRLAVCAVLIGVCVPLERFLTPALVTLAARLLT